MRRRRSRGCGVPRRTPRRFPPPFATRPSVGRTPRARRGLRASPATAWCAELPAWWTCFGSTAAVRPTYQIGPVCPQPPHAPPTVLSCSCRPGRTVPYLCTCFSTTKLATRRVTGQRPTKMPQRIADDVGSNDGGKAPFCALPGHRSLPPRRALGAKFYAGGEGESKRLELWLLVVAGSSHPGLASSALVGKQ